MPHWFIVTLFCAAPLLTSGEGHAAPADTPPAFDAIERFEESIPHNLLRGLYDQALAALHEYIEIEGNLPGDGETQARAGEFSLRLFPRGKSRSQEHLSAEGSFRLSPEPGQQEFSLRFKSSKRQPAPLTNGEII